MSFSSFFPFFCFHLKNGVIPFDKTKNQRLFNDMKPRIMSWIFKWWVGISIILFIYFYSPVRKEEKEKVCTSIKPLPRHQCSIFFIKSHFELLARTALSLKDEDGLMGWGLAGDDVDLVGDDVKFDHIGGEVGRVGEFCLA